MKKIAQLFASILMCESAGIMGSVFTAASIPTWYATLNRPSFSPPNWLFGPVWTTLYLMMGVSFYLVWQKGWKKKKNVVAGKLFLIQLFFNFTWSVVFFGFQSPILGLINILILWSLIALTIKYFYKISKVAAYLLIPYLGWVSFATLLNAAIAVLN